MTHRNPSDKLMTRGEFDARVAVHVAGQLAISPEAARLVVSAHEDIVARAFRAGHLTADPDHDGFALLGEIIATAADQYPEPLQRAS